MINIKSKFKPYPRIKSVHETDHYKNKTQFHTDIK